MKAITLLAACALAACAVPPAAPSIAPPESSVPPDPAPSPGPAQPPTRILDRAMAERLLGNGGITLQWIGWEDRGVAEVNVGGDGVWRLSASQAQPGMGSVTVRGDVVEIGSDYFVLDGTIEIVDAPDRGRNCGDTKRWHFGITQNRQYWRLREFEWCDGLTDYIDIYF